MIYKRSFRIQAAHFNGLESYEKCWDRSLTKLSWDEIVCVLMDCHGHNFKIDIEISTDNYKVKDNWIIDDVALLQIVSEWDSLNLSVHDDFLPQKIRATTENMAIVLASRLEEEFSAFYGMHINVTIHETDEISATAAVTIHA